MPPQSRSEPTGARESNAGDEFHVLWATRRLLGLLDPSSGLQSVVMEGLDPPTLDGVADADLLGIDLTEYYADAGQIVISQLKYSSRHPTTAWTTARLAQPRTQHRPRTSVIARLGLAFAALMSQGQRDDALSRLTVRLVSNQPVGVDLADALGAAQAWLTRQPSQVTAASLLRALGTRRRAQIKRLYEASTLRSRDFTDLLRVLALDVGQDSLADQELLLTMDLGESVAANLEFASLSLRQLVRNRALPGKGQPIDLHAVLAALHVPGLDSLLPAPSRLTWPEDPIATPDARRIIGALDAAPDRRLLAYGKAGIGKTTSLMALERELPTGSVVVVFDCYAGGGYTTPVDERHTPERALVQLCNNLAIRCRLPMLVVGPSTPNDLWRHFRRRLERAAAELRHAGARLIIAIDAADNSLWAARRDGRRSFVEDLWAFDIPEGAGLVVTARPERADLGAGDDLPQIELLGFDLAGSTENLRRRFANADDAACAAFHERSEGNPRLQFYVLSAADDAESAATVDEAVALASKTPPDIFENLWSSAIEQAPDRRWAQERLGELVCVSKPLTIEQMALAAGATSEGIDRFVRRLAPGLKIEGDRLAFRDEEFESYLRDKLDDEEIRAANDRLATRFMGRPDDSFAAESVAGHLAAAERKDDLIKLVLEERSPTAWEDHAARVAVFLDRIRRALQVVEPSLEAAQLLVHAAQATKSERVIAGIVLKQPELALRHGDPDAVARVWQDAENVAWLGPIHMRLAAIAARRGDADTARHELAAGQAWLQRRHDEDRRNWTLEPEDLAAAMEAFYWLDGLDGVADRMRRWPPGLMLSVAEHLGTRLVRLVDSSRLAAEVGECEALPGQAQARLLCALHPTRLPNAAVEPIVSKLLTRPTRREHRSGRWGIVLTEIVAAAGADRKRVLALLASVAPDPPRWAPYRRLEKEHQHLLRTRALAAAYQDRELDIEELMPTSVTSPVEPTDHDANERQASDRRAVTELFGPLLSIYSFRARAMLLHPPVQQVAEELRGDLERARRATGGRFGERMPLFHLWAEAACEGLIACSGADATLVSEIAEAADETGEHGPSVWRRMARVLIADERYRDEGLILIARAADDEEQEAQPASETTDFLLSLAQLSHGIDGDLTADLYRRAIDMADQIDDDAIARLGMHARVAAGLHGQAHAQLADDMSEALIACRHRVSDEDRLPWRDTLATVTSMHPPTGLATLTRWEDQRVLRLQRGLGPAIEAAVAGGLLSARDGLTLLTLHSEQGSPMPTACTLLEVVLHEDGAQALVGRLAEVSLRIRRDLHDDARRRAARDLFDWASEHGFESTEAVRALRPYAAVDRRPDGPSPVAIQATVEAASDVDVSPEQLSAALDAAWRTTDGGPSVYEVLSRSVEDVPPARRTAVLDALTDLDADHPVVRFGLEDLLHTLEKALETWGRAQAVKQWRANKLDNYLARTVASAVRYWERGDDLLDQLLSMSTDPARVLLDGAAESIDALRPTGLFLLARAIGERLDDNDRSKLIRWSLDELGVESAGRRAADMTRGECLAGQIWALFGHVEKQVRWRAAHAARELLAADDGTLADLLLTQSEAHGGGAFVDASLPFFWLSARTWTLMTLARAIDDEPRLGVSLAERLSSVALDRGWPHAAHREFARRAALTVAGAYPGVVDKSLVEQLRMANQPASCFTQRAHVYGRGGSGDGDQLRLQYGIDTLPYWFGPLGVRFAVGVDEVASMAEAWIIDELGAQGERDSNRDDPRLGLLDWGDYSDRQGSLPRAETPRLTFDYHAMLLVAGQLADTRSVVVSPHDDPDDTWTSWLARHLDARPSGWNVDLRSPPPPDRGVLDVEVIGERWPALTDADFERMLVGGETDAVVVDGYVSYYASIGYGTDAVDTALVAPSTAASLLRALQAAPDPSLFGFPKIPTDDDYREHEIDVGHFRLIGWTSERDLHADGLEYHDPLARLQTSPAWPGPDFISHHRAETSSNGLSLLDHHSSRIAWIRAFNDDPPPRRGGQIEHFYASGTETFVSRSALVAYLHNIGMDMIFRLSANRHVRSDHERIRQNAPQEHPLDRQEQYRFVLLRRDGSVAGFTESH